MNAEFEKETKTETKNKTGVLKILAVAEGIIVAALVIAVIFLACRGSNSEQENRSTDPVKQAAADNSTASGKIASDASADTGNQNSDATAETADKADGTNKPSDSWENYSKTYDDWREDAFNSLQTLNDFSFPFSVSYHEDFNHPYENQHYFYDKIVENQENCLRLIYLIDCNGYFELVFALDNNSGNNAYMDIDILTEVIDSISVVIDNDKVLDEKSVSERYDFNRSSFNFSVAIDKQGLEATNNMKLVFADKTGGQGINKIIDLIADNYLTSNIYYYNRHEATRAFFDRHPEEFPQIDSSTARKPITAAIFSSFIGWYDEKRAEKYAALSPWCNKTHGAWLNLADRTADLVFLVMPTAEEKQYLAERNVPIEIKPYGADGLAIILNPDAPVKSFTVDQIRQIYEGKITNWKELGGEDHPINPLYRNEQSGSQRMFEEFLWPDGDVPDFSKFNTIDSVIGTFEEYGDMESITVQVFDDPYAIGYNIVSYIHNEFSEGYVEMAKINGVYPNTESFTDRTYPFTTTAYVAIRADEPQFSPARMLFEWLDTYEFNIICRSSSSLSVFDWKRVEVYDYANLLTDVDEIIECMRDDKLIADRCNLTAMSDENLAILRNALYAFNGKQFKKQEYTDFFNKYYWYYAYNDTLSDDQIYAFFSENEKKNLALIMAEEKKRKNQ